MKTKKKDLDDIKLPTAGKEFTEGLMRQIRSLRERGLECARMLGFIGSVAAITEAANLEYAFWDSQLPHTLQNNADLYYDNRGYFDEPTASRIRCLFSIPPLLYPLGGLKELGIECFPDWLRWSEEHLETIAKDAPIAAPRPEGEEFREWAERRRIERQIDELKRELDAKSPKCRSVAA